MDFGAWARANRLPWVAGAWVVALAIVATLQRPDVTLAAARATYVLLAVYGLQLLARDTSQPSLGHAAFLALGAYGTAFLRLRAGLDGLTAALVLTVLGALLGWLLGLGVTHLRPAFLALLTWTLGWAVYVGLGALPDLSGGIAGISIREPMRVRWDSLGVDVTFTDAGHLALGTGLLALLLLLYRSAQTSVIGRGWAALRDSRALATSLGYDVAATRRHTFAVAAAMATLAGALGADLVRVVDPTSYSPLQSLNLLAAVLIGVPLGFFGPLAGALVTSGAPYLVDQLSALAGVPLGTGRELASATLTLAAVTLSFRLGLRPPGLRAHASRTARTNDAPAAGGLVEVPPAALATRDIHVEFDGVRALDGVSIAIEPATIHGLVGPNGSGKSTLLRCLAGSIPYSGTVRLGDLPLEGLAEFRRVRAGVTRTFQRTATMPHLTAREHVEAGLRVRYRASGWAQALFRTPRYRHEARDGRRQAHAFLAAFGLGEHAESRPHAMSGGHQRLLQIATAAATGPRALLLDEPSAGMDAAELEILESGLRTIVAGGTSVLLVEHNFGFLARLAQGVTVLDAGVVIAEGTPGQVAADPEVRRAYLGVSSGPMPAPPRRAPRTRKPRPKA